MSCVKITSKYVSSLSHSFNMLSSAFVFSGGLQYIYSQRKRPLLIINDFLYRRNRQNYWRCIRSTSQKCRASLILQGTDLVTLCITEHTHPAEKDKLKNRNVNQLDSMTLSPEKSKK